MGAAEEDPESPSSRLSSKPTQTTQSKLLVKPANQPSCDVPVLPAAGAVKPRARTPAPCRRLPTSETPLATGWPTRGSSAGRVGGWELSNPFPLALTPLPMNIGSARVPALEKTV